MWLSTLCTFHLFSFTNWLHVHITESVMDCIINYQQLGFWNLPAACFLCSKVCGTMSPTWPLLLQQYYINNHQTASRPTCYILFYHHHQHCAWWPRSAIGGNWAIFPSAKQQLSVQWTPSSLLPPPPTKLVQTSSHATVINIACEGPKMLPLFCTARVCPLPN